MSNFSNKTRVNKFDKRRKNTKMLSTLIIVGGILLLVLIALWIFGGNDKEEVETNENNLNIEQNSDNQMQNDNETENDIDNSAGNNEATEDNVVVTDNENEESNNNNNSDENPDENSEKESVEASDDNVKEAYKANWEPVGTEQSGAHTTVYDKGSTDWNEMEEAARMATGLNDMYTWWIGNGGDQKVVATVSDPGETQVYRVYLSWVDNEGWQPTKVEELIENDKP